MTPNTRNYINNPSQHNLDMLKEEKENFMIFDLYKQTFTNAFASKCLPYLTKEFDVLCEVEKEYYPSIHNFDPDISSAIFFGLTGNIALHTDPCISDKNNATVFWIYKILGNEDTSPSVSFLYDNEDYIMHQSSLCIFDHRKNHGLMTNLGWIGLSVQGIYTEKV